MTKTARLRRLQNSADVASRRSPRLWMHDHATLCLYGLEVRPKLRRNWTPVWILSFWWITPYVTLLVLTLPACFGARAP